MKELALSLQGGLTTPTPIEGFPDLKPDLSAANLGYLISQFMDIVFMIAGFLMFIWGAWGVLEYLFAGGNKEGLGKARGRITWAIVGFIFIAIAFLVSQYLGEIFAPRTAPLPDVTGGF